MFGLKQRNRPGAAALLVVMVWVFIAGSAAAQETSRIKDLAILEGTTEEPLVGYGLVVGLNGSGDSYSVENTANSIATLLEKLDVTISPRDLKARNVAAVIVTDELAAVLIEDTKINDSALVVFPNPVANILNVHASSEIQTVQIYTSTGQKLRAITVDGSKETRVDVSALSPQLYYIEIKTAKGVVLEKLIKE